ncbi:hypothetical protein [Acinetobacter sp.]|uniref:hypothetical protein n=1 Tax=Acinetobacter sp. TaxID=472 RepID=UPI003C77739A
MTLKKIQIENVKGISNRTFELNIFPNKPSLLVAPNGFGKSSFASAFLSLQSNKISVQDHHLHKNQQDLESKLLIEYECPQNIVHSLEANTTSNTISEHFSWFVINNQIKAKGIGRNIGGRTNVSADIAIEPVTLIDTIPDREDFSYSYQSQKADFGVNGKILPNISDCFKNLSFITSLVNYYDALDKMAQIRNQRRIDEIILDINNQSGTVSTLKKWIEENGIQKFSAIEPLDSLAKHILNSYLNINQPILSYLAAIQIHNEYKKDKSKFKKAIKYSSYKLESIEFKDILKAFNTSWHNISPREVRSKLVVEFPKANQISNGQRDVITFITLLYKAQKKLKGQNAILIIDEVFDYLDDANLVAVQYYITKFIKKFKDDGRRLYPLILTHLNPFYFKNFAFNNQKVYFLDKRDIQSDQAMIKLLRKRDEAIIKDDVSKFLLHYHPEKINKRADFQTLDLRETWGEGDHFYNFINSETIKYIENGTEFDPLAVCCAVRVAVEKYAYLKLSLDLYKQEFLTIFKTRDKLVYAESKGVSIPEYFYLLGVIYNDGMHWKEGQDNISSIASKLENQTIRYLINQVITLSNS